mgnify:CR=1 FL=1
MAEGSNGRRRFSDKWGKHELDVLAVLSSAFPQWLTSRQIAQRVKAYADSYGELADQAAKAAFAKQFQRDRAKLAAMGIAIESRQPEYSSKSEGRISLPTVCSLAMSRACVCCSATRICRFLPLRITLRAPCRFPRLLRTNPSTLPVPRRACRRRRFQDLAWIPSRRVLARNPFPTSWSKWSISGVSPPLWMLMRASQCRLRRLR